MSKKSLVVFDHDGTLVNSLPVVVEASNAVLAAFGFPGRPAPEIVAGMVHPTAPRLGRLAGVTDPDRQRELAHRFDELAWQAAKRATLYPGIRALLERLRARGLPMAVLSNSAGRFIRTVLRHLAVDDYFSWLVGEDDMPAPKPDPRGLARIMRLAGRGPNETVYVGDSRTDRETARAAGVAALGVTWGAHRREELAPLGFHALVDTPDEIPAFVEDFPDTT